MREHVTTNTGQQHSRSAAANVSAHAISRPAIQPFGMPVVQRNHDLVNIEVGKNKWSDEAVSATWAISESLDVNFGALKIEPHLIHSMEVEKAPASQELHMALTWIGVDNKIYRTNVLKSYKPKVGEHTEIQAAKDMFDTAKEYYVSKKADPQQKMKGLIIEIRQTLSPCNSCATYLQGLVSSLTVKTIVRASSVKKHSSKIGAAIDKYNPENAKNEGSPDMNNIDGLHLKSPNMEWE